MEFVFDDESSTEIQGSEAAAGSNDRFYEFFDESPIPVVPMNFSSETPSPSRKSALRKYRESRVSDVSTTAPSGVSELSSLQSPSLLDGPSYKQRRNQRRRERRKEEKRKQQGADDSMPQVLENGPEAHSPTAPQGEPSSHLQTTLGGVPMSYLAIQLPTFFSGHSHVNKQSVLFGHLSAGSSGLSCEVSAMESPIQRSAASEDHRDLPCDSEKDDSEVLRMGEVSIIASSEEPESDSNESCDFVLNHSEDDDSGIWKTDESSITASSEEPESGGNEPWDGVITAKVLFRQHMADAASAEIDNAAAFRRLQMLRRIREARTP